MRGSRNAPRRPGAISRSPSTTRVRVLACAPGVDARKCELFQTSPGCEDALTTKLPTWEDADAADRGTNLDITINAAATRVNLFLEHATSAPLLLGFSANYTQPTVPVAVVHILCALSLMKSPSSLSVRVRGRQFRRSARPRKVATQQWLRVQRPGASGKTKSLRSLAHPTLCPQGGPG